MRNRIRLNGRGLALCAVTLTLLVAGGIMAQLQQSGGPGTSVTVSSGTLTAVTTITNALPAGANLMGKVGIDQTTPGTTNGVVVNSGTLTAVTSITNPLPAGTNLLGYFKQRPNGCSALTSDVVHDTVGVATGAGTSVSSVTGCVLECYVNNITNSAVTLRIADKTGTPIIWVGGNADFSIPANSNMGCGGSNGIMLAGVTMASGITAIAGTGSALNLHIVTRE